MGAPGLVFETWESTNLSPHSHVPLQPEVPIHDAVSSRHEWESMSLGVFSISCLFQKSVILSAARLGPHR